MNDRDLIDNPKIWTIPPGTPFLRTLAQHILAGGFPRPGVTPPDAQSLSHYTILVPTRRAAGALEDVFLDVSDGRALLLPRIRPLGDVDEDELTLIGQNTFGNSYGEGAQEFSLPPAISGMRRQLLLARILLDWARNHHDTALAEALLPGPSQAISMAQGLATLIDQLETEQISTDMLGSIIREDFARYWQDILMVLDAIRTQLPTIMKDREWIGPMERRNLLLGAQAKRLQENPPDHPIIVAGSTGSIPATARLLNVISKLPLGGIVLPGLDMHLDEESWQALDPQHPQFGLHQLLGELSVERSDVKELEGVESGPENDLRARLFSEVMRPSDTTDKWHSRLHELKDIAPDAIKSLHHVPAANRREEALAIAAIMRGTLETPGKTAALVTPDRALSRQVCAELVRWNLSVDDSAGIPLARTEQGRFIHLLLEASLGFDPAALVSLGQHPLSLMHSPAGAFARAMSKLELAAFRGPLSIKSLDKLPELIDAKRQEVAAKPHWFSHLRFWDDQDWQDALFAAKGLADLLAPFQALKAARIPLETAIKLLLQAAETLATDETGTPSALWSNEAGESLSSFFSSLLEASTDAPLVEPQDIGPVIMDLMMTPIVRPRFGSHPRLQILGLLEARMIAADVVILGGLNEDVWPRLPRSDPWLNRPMRSELELQQPERRIGLAAHDFVQGACGGEVWLTTSQRLEGTPAIPSRWLLRLKALLQACGVEGIEKEGHRLLNVCAQLDAAGAPEPVSRPSPRPPVTARPRKLSITEIEKWLRDPYSIFARHILHLDPLDPINSKPGPRERGVLFHDILEEFLTTYNAALPGDITAALEEIADQKFAQFEEWPEAKAFWRPRFSTIARAMASEELKLRDGVTTTHIEIVGRTTINGPHGEFQLSGRADRIDMLQAGGARIIDYKSGQLPGVKEVLKGLAPQLLLEAAILARGGFSPIAPVDTTELAYVNIPGGDPALTVRPVNPGKGQPLAEIAENIFAALKARVADFDDPATPYPSRVIPRNLTQEFSYDHLARFREWANAEAGEGFE